MRRPFLVVSFASVAIALFGCPKKNDAPPASGDASTTSAAPSAAAAAPKPFDRRLAGVVGAEAKATMHLVRDGDHVSGEYAYAKVGRSIALTGTAAPDGTLTLQESVGGKPTGEFKGQLASDGAFSGTWTNPAGDKKFPFRFEPSADAVVPALVDDAPPTGKGKPIAVATNDEAADALVKVAKAKGSNVDHADAKKDFEDLTTSEYAKDAIDRRKAFEKRYGLDFYTGFVRLYVGDANNDGTTDYLFTETNPVGLHNDDVVAVFLGKGDKVTKAAMPRVPQLDKTATNFSMAVDPEGTVLYFTEAGGPKGKVHRVLWKGTTAKQL